VWHDLTLGYDRKYNHLHAFPPGLILLQKSYSYLVNQAAIALKRPFAPYSKFCVGSEVLTEGGNIYLGCNMVNLSFGATTCAERIALYNAFVVGQRLVHA